MQPFGGVVNLNVHFHLLVLDGVFAEVDDDVAFALLPASTGADLLAILDRVIHEVTRRLAKEAAASNDPDDTNLPPDLFAQVQSEAGDHLAFAATTHGARRQSMRARCAGFSLHAGVWPPTMLERLCRYGARPAFATTD